MNPAHWHLVVNHLPIIGGIFASLILIYGIVFKNESAGGRVLYRFGNRKFCSPSNG